MSLRARDRDGTVTTPRTHAERSRHQEWQIPATKSVGSFGDHTCATRSTSRQTLLLLLCLGSPKTWGAYAPYLRSRLAKPDTTDPDMPYAARDDKPWAAPRWPRLQPDGRYAIGTGLNARLGWCTIKIQEGSSSPNGYEALLSGDSGSPGQAFWVPFVRGTVPRPSGEQKV
nr:hypothetical protein [Frigoribacterium sp. PvP032]